MTDFTKEFVDANGRLCKLNDKGEEHSLLSPAVIDSDGTKFWCQEGRMHRLDGPAYEGNGYKVWYYNDKWYGNSVDGYTQEKFLEDLKDKGEIERTKEEMEEYLKNTYSDDIFYWNTSLSLERRYNIVRWYMTLTNEQKSMISDIRHESSLDTEFSLSEGA